MQENVLLEHDEHFVLQLVGQFDAAQVEASAPCRHLVLPHGVEHVGKLFHLLVRVCVRRRALEGVQFFVVEVFDRFRGSLHHALLLALRRCGAVAGGTGLLHVYGRVVVLATVGDERAYRCKNAEGYYRQYQYCHLCGFLYNIMCICQSFIFSIFHPAISRSSQNCGYDFVTTCGSLMRRPGNLMAAGANAIAMRWS